jgi:HD-GYP domain-containing protein (c-di-GMP phosphodiesterase class II)
MNVNKNIEEIKPLVYAIEIRDAYTQGHSEHVGVYSSEFASFLGLDKKESEKLYIAGLLHDIGKIGIPDSILLKPGKLEKDEFDIIKLHSVISGKIVEKLPDFSNLADIVRHHHENYDGSGYPDGLKGEEIPLGARILSFADVFDALTTGRVYRAPLSLE